MPNHSNDGTNIRKASDSLVYKNPIDEQEAAWLYSRSLLREGEAPNEKETAVACIYEYTREIISILSEKEGFQESIDDFLAKLPFRLFASDQPMTGTRHYQIPWTKIPIEDSDRIVKRFLYSYADTEVTPLPIGKLLTDYFSGVFEKFGRAAQDVEADLKTAFEEGNIQKITPLIERQSVIPDGESRERIVFQIDYRHKPGAVLKQFRAFLKTRKKSFADHAAEIKGSRFFRERLRDLANTRLFREFDMDQLDRKKIRGLDNESSYSEAKSRVVRFTRFLQLTKFVDLRELEMTYQKPLDKYGDERG